MILKTVRNLKDNLFSTKIQFVAYGKRDEEGNIDEATGEVEKQLVDDYGFPTVGIGGTYAGKIKNTSGKLSIEEIYATTEEAKGQHAESDEEIISFILNDRTYVLDEKFEMLINIKVTEAGEHLTAEQVAEAKCLIFEKIMKERIEKIVADFKKKLTDFETSEENGLEFEVPITE